MSLPSTDIAAPSEVPILDRSRGALVSFLIVLAFFFVSGACGLVYQVVWTRKLVLLFGTTSYAVSTVLSIFFLGLGLGSFWGGRLADRTRRPLFLYGLFEVIIAFWAVGFIALIGSGEGVVVSLLQHFGGDRGSGVVLRALLALAFLIVPVSLMGATLPLLSRHAVQRLSAPGRRIGALYSVNTFGAVTGCMLAGFVLIPALGYTRATWLGAALNLAVGVLALWLGRAKLPATEAGPATKTETPTAHRRLGAEILIVFALSGFCALGLEVLWTRLLAIIFIGTTYAFTTVLATILCGIAIGGGVAALWADRGRFPQAALGLAEVLFGFFTLVTLVWFPALPGQLSTYMVDTGYDWNHILREKFFLSFSVLFLPALFSGMTFPLAVRAYMHRAPGLGRGIGRLYAVNTLGGVLGALAGGYLLIPLLGTHKGVLLLAMLLLGGGLVLILDCPGPSKRNKSLLAAATALAVVFMLQALPPDAGRALTQSYLPEKHREIHYREGVEGTVVVAEPENATSGRDRVLFINAVQATASIEKGVKMNRFQGALPFLFDRDLKRALFMCFGSGITCSTLGLFDLERIDAVEISPDVLEAAPLFKTDNFDVTSNPKIRFVVDDGRNFLLTQRDRYDLITFEPMPLALAGVSTFYTQEFYRLCLDHLTDGGLVSQWVPLHSLDPDVVRSLVYTFTTVFPHYTAWFVNADLFLIGSNQPLTIEYARAAKRLSRGVVQNALRQVGLTDPPELLTGFLMSQDAIGRYLAAGPVQVMRDDRPWAEFIAPRLMYENTVAQTLRELQPFIESPLPLVRYTGIEENAESLQSILSQRYRAKQKDFEGLIAYYSGLAGGTPETHFKAALDIDPNDANARYYLREIAKAKGKLFLRWEEIDSGVAFLTDLLRYLPDEPELYLRLGDLQYKGGRIDEAVQSYRRYQALGGDPAIAQRRLAEGPPANEAR